MSIKSLDQAILEGGHLRFQDELDKKGKIVYQDETDDCQPSPLRLKYYQSLNMERQMYDLLNRFTQSNHYCGMAYTYVFFSGQAGLRSPLK